MPSRIARLLYLMLIVSGGLSRGCVPTRASQSRRAGTSQSSTAAEERAALTTDGAAVYETLRRASVEILIDGRMTGCGCFVGTDGLVLTAFHVVKGRKDGIEVLSAVLGRRPARRVAADPGHDLALLRVGGAGPGAPGSLSIAARMPPPTAGVLLFGSPLWRHDLVLKGSVAKLTPCYCWQPALRCYVRCFYIAGASPVGSSGGCWVDARGRVVGVQLGYLNNQDGSPVGIAFASPLDAIRRLLATGRSHEAATLGGAMEELWTQPAGFIARLPKGTRGIVTPTLYKDGALAKAGLTKETIITRAEGRPVAYLDDLLTIVRSRKPGDEITLTVIEPIGKPQRQVTLRLGKVGQ